MEVGSSSTESTPARLARPLSFYTQPLPGRRAPRARRQQVLQQQHRTAESQAPKGRALSSFFLREPRQEGTMRKRRFTETFGCLITLQEREIMQAYLRERKLTPTQYLRETAVRPVVELAKQAEVQDGAE
jgi:hypothetical protein